MDELLEAFQTAGPADTQMVALAFLLSFVLGQATAWMYMWTHSGLSYSRSFVQSLVLLPIVLAMAMVVLTMANSLVIAFGLMGAVAIVRFRNILKDTRDTAFLLLALVIGVAVGTGAFEIAVVGTGAICLVLGLLHVTAFGSRQRFDVILSLRVAGGADALAGLWPILRRHCRKAVLASHRASEEATAADVSYRLLLRDPARSGELIEELSAEGGVSHLSMVQRDNESEV
ncbi:MAG: DUF4956 domain-containing protein [Planctomycetota bacterium]